MCAYRASVLACVCKCVCSRIRGRNLSWGWEGNTPWLLAFIIVNIIAARLPLGGAPDHRTGWSPQQVGKAWVLVCFDQTEADPVYVEAQWLLGWLPGKH